MTTSLIPAPNAAPEPLPVALTAADADRIAAAISAARTESTRRVYAYTWGQWARWCAARGLTALPGDPAALCAYLTERAGEGTAIASLDGACTAIRHVHRMHAVADPVASETVRQVRLGLRRTYGTAPRRLARPLTTADIRRIVGGIDRTTPLGARDAAIILLGYASAMRRSELTALTLVDVEEKPAGLLITVRRSKTDQEGHGQTVGVARGTHALTDPVAALAGWRKLRGPAPGPLFTRLWRGRISLQPLSGDAIARMLRSRAQAAGLDAERITAHSLRAGHATTAALAGARLDRIAAQTRHRDLSVLVNRYIRPLEALATNAAVGRIYPACRFAVDFAQRVVRHTAHRRAARLLVLRGVDRWAVPGGRERGAANPPASRRWSRSPRCRTSSSAPGTGSCPGQGRR